MTRTARRAPRAPLCALAGILILAACTSSSRQPAEVVIRGTNPNAAPGQAATVVRPGISGPATADASGVITYDGYQTVIARPGDTVASVADRVGLSASELGAYNGLRPANPLRPGDELVLPPRPGGYGDAVPTADSGLPQAAPGEATSGTIVALPLDDTASAQTVTPAAPAAPTSTWSPDIAAAAIERSVGVNADGTLGAPPSSVEPVPPEPSPGRALASPNLGQYQTEASDVDTTTPPPQKPDTATPAPGETIAALEATRPAAPKGPLTRLRRPVDGPVAVGFNKGSGANRNDGVDFAVPAGSTVVAAADGEVALVSESLGGLGTIVLLRHSDDLLTVYGRIEGVTVRKGQYVKSGQPIGVVSDARAPAKPMMHFEVRRGAESLDPMKFL